MTEHENENRQEEAVPAEQGKEAAPAKRRKEERKEVKKKTGKDEGMKPPMKLSFWGDKPRRGKPLDLSNLGQNSREQKEDSH